MQIEFNGDVYDVNVTSSTPYVEATFHDPAEGGEIEFDLELDGIEIDYTLFTDSEWEKIEQLVRDEMGNQEQYDNDEYLSEMAADRNDRY